MDSLFLLIIKVSRCDLLQLVYIQIRFVFFQIFDFTFMPSLLTEVKRAFFSVDYLFHTYFLVSNWFLFFKTIFSFRCHTTYVLILMLYFKISLVHISSYHFHFAGTLVELHCCGYSLPSFYLSLILFLLICSNNILKKKQSRVRGRQAGRYTERGRHRRRDNIGGKISIWWS